MNTIRTSDPAARPHVVVLGGGYAGTMGANRLSASARVTLVNPRPRFVHRIRLHQWAVGTGTAADDYGRLLADGVDLVVDSATRIDVAAGRVELADRPPIGFDHLVYAVGSTGADIVPGAAEHAFGLGDWDSACRLRDRLTRLEPDEVISVVGGGLTAMEFAAELAESSGADVRLICDGVVGPSLGAAARASARRRLHRLGVEVNEHLGVTEVGSDEVSVRGADGTPRRLPSAVTVVAAGFAVPTLAADSGLTTDAAGRLVTDETLTSVDDARIVGAGDAVAPSGIAFRMSCQAANQLGPQAADNVVARLRGRTPGPVRVSFLAQCVSLGRGGGVVAPTRRDDVPRSWAMGGRTAAVVKELVCRSVTAGMRLEARRPGSVPGFGGEPRVTSASETTTVSS